MQQGACHIHHWPACQPAESSLVRGLPVTYIPYLRAIQDQQGLQGACYLHPWRQLALGSSLAPRCLLFTSWLGVGSSLACLPAYRVPAIYIPGQLGSWRVKVRRCLAWRWVPLWQQGKQPEDTRGRRLPPKILKACREVPLKAAG